MTFNNIKKNEVINKALNEMYRIEILNIIHASRINEIYKKERVQEEIKSI